MSFLAFLALPQILPFTAALALLLGLLAFELAGLGGLGHDLDADHDAGALAWLGAGQVPLTILIVLLLATFGGLGLVSGAAAMTVRGGPLSAWIVGPLALLVALPVTRVLAGAVHRLLPGNETAALPRAALVGQRGTITLGRAAIGEPARARVRDALGGVHYVMVEPEAADGPLGEGSEVLLTRADGAGFRAIAVDPHPFMLRS